MHCDKEIGLRIAVESRREGDGGLLRRRMSTSAAGGGDGVPCGWLGTGCRSEAGGGPAIQRVPCLLLWTEVGGLDRHAAGALVRLDRKNES